MKNSVYILFAFILNIASTNSYSQNLVPNYSFEVSDTCPYSAGQIYYVQPWEAAVVNSSSDYFNSCGVAGGAGVPLNFAGTQTAKDGNAYAGIIMYAAPSGTNWREYIQAQLLSTLFADTCYHLIFYVSIADYNKYNVTSFGAYFSSVAVLTCDQCILSFTPQINFTDPSGIGSSSGWYKVEGTFKAQGGEQYITIGNFNSDANTAPLIVNSGQPDFAYYYIDSVSLTKVVCPIDIGINENSNPNFSFNLSPNPNDGNVILNYSIKSSYKAEIKIYDIAGKLISGFQLNSLSTQMQIHNDLFNNGIYFYQILLNDRIVQSDKLIIIK